MTLEKTVHFTADRLTLTGTLHLPDAPDPPLVVGCHGLMADRSSPKQIALATACAQQGLAYLRFDHRGCGESQGDRQARVSLTERCEDLRHAIDAMRLRPDVGPLLGLFGSSFGGTVVLSLAARQPVSTLVTYAAPISISFAAGAVAHNPALLSLKDKTPLFDISADLSAQHSILVVHGDCDPIVPLDHARQIYKLARDPKQLVIQPGGDHPMSDPAHQRRFVDQAVAWFARALAVS